MLAFFRTLRHNVASSLSSFLPDETIESAKKRWDSLARDNARYYVVSKKGRSISEEEFREVGEENYRDYISHDPLVRDTLGTFTDKRVLDIGSGLGRLTELFARDFKEVDGVDISETMVREAQKRLAHIGNVRFHATDGVSYPFPDATFDLVFSFVVFQHMPNKEIVERNLREVRRVLKPSGIAKIQIRGGATPHKWRWFYGPAFTQEEGVTMAENVGFRVLKTEGADTKLFWLWLAK